MRIVSTWLLFLSILITSNSVGVRKRVNAAETANTVDTSSVGDREFVRRSGIRQRLDVASSSGQNGARQVAQQQNKDLPLTQALKQDWARGIITSKQVHRYAYTALQQGAAGLDHISSMGNFGENPQHLFQALVNYFGVPLGAPPIDWIELPTTAGARSPHPVIWPHKFFAKMFEERLEDFGTYLSGPDGACSQFWQSMRDTPFVQGHPDLAESSWSKTIPLGMHGDAGAFSHDSLFVISWNSLMGMGSTITKRFVFTVIKKSDMRADTLDAILKHFSWSCNALLAGKFPETSTDLANGWRGSLCQVRGDWQFYCQALYFPSWNAGEMMCWLCRASARIPELVYTNCRKDAGWRGTRWDHESYLEHLRVLGMAVPVLFLFVIGLRLECVTIDVLHAIDQGFGSHVLGNLLWYLACIRKVFGNCTQAECVKNLNRHIQAWYKKTKCPNRIRGDLSVEDLRKTGGYPKLRAKAAATRHLAPYVKELMTEFCTDDINERRMKRLIEILCQFYSILEQESMFLSAVSMEILPKIGQRGAELYTMLAEHFSEAGQGRMFKPTPKLHLWEHLTEHQMISIGNARYFWTYSDEDLVGAFVEIAESVHAKSLSISCLFKWLHLYFD